MERGVSQTPTTVGPDSSVCMSAIATSNTLININVLKCYKTSGRHSNKVVGLSNLPCLSKNKQGKHVG